jgi:hypothetical protein
VKRKRIGFSVHWFAVSLWANWLIIMQAICIQYVTIANTLAREVLLLGRGRKYAEGPKEPSMTGIQQGLEAGSGE